MLWETFVEFITEILKAIEAFCGDWGLAIIILTIVIRLILTPLTLKSTKSSAQMQILQPKLKEIQDVYKDDPKRQQEELRKIYSEHKFNPLGGCLPLLLQMPVFFALFQVLKNVSTIDPNACFYGIFPHLGDSASKMFEVGGFAAAWVYILFDLAFGALTFLPMWLNTRTNPGQQQSTTLVMGVVMAAMMIWFGWSVAAGVLLYYNASALWGVAQQQLITRRMMDKYKAEEEAKMANKPIEVNVVRKEKKKRPTKKTK